MGQQIRVVLINDVQLFAESVAALLNRQASIVLEGTITRLRDIPAKLQSSSADIALIDATMEARSTVPLIREIKNENPNLKVIVIGLDNSEESVLRFIEAGVNGYTLKDASFDELVHMINNIHQGLMPCPPRIAGAVFARVTELSQRRAGLFMRSGSWITPREKKILELIAMGLSNKEIAQHLRISLYTVKNHVHNILDKLQVRYRREALRYAYENGLVKRPALQRLSVQKD